MNIEDIKEKRLAFEGRISIAETDWLIAEIERLGEMISAQAKVVWDDGQAMMKLRTEVEKITKERDELFHKWSKTNGLTTRETAVRCAEIVRCSVTREEAIEYIEKEFIL